jgi:deoxyribose-phosphate aldolase
VTRIAAAPANGAGRPADLLAAAVDATLLTPWARPGEVRALCEEACALQVAAVCVLPQHLPLARAVVAGTRVRVAAVAAFPGGSAPPAAKALEARLAAAAGAEELDVVLNLGAIRAGSWDVVAEELSAVREAAPDATLKWILEMAALDAAEIERAVALAAEARADFVKTSTGYGPGGATVERVRFLRSLAGPMGVKASGGIRTRAFALSLLAAGADRIGTSRPRAVVTGEEG